MEQTHGNAAPWRVVDLLFKHALLYTSALSRMLSMLILCFCFIIFSRMLALTIRSAAAVPVSEEDKRATPPTSSQPAVVIPKTTELSRPDEKSIYLTANILEKPTFIPPKPISHSPKISPSSIPNPNPSVTTTKQVEPGYPTYGGFMYSVPGYSAFQPVAYPGIVQPTPVTLPQKDSPSTDGSVLHVPIKDNVKLKILDDKPQDVPSTENVPPNDIAKSQSDFEDRFVSEVITSIPKPPTDVSSAPLFEQKINTAPLPQTSLSASMPSLSSNKELIKKKPPERFSLKTSIPISKIDIKCVNNTTDSLFLNNANRKPFNPAFHTPIKEINSKVEIQSNIVIKSAQKESEATAIQMGSSHNSISTLINAAEAINKNDSDFKKPEITSDPSNDVRESSVAVPASSVTHRPIFNPMNIETSKTTFETKTTDSSFADQKNQILFIQNKNPTNQKMLLTFQQQNPQVVVQRTCYDSKNLQAPSRPSNQSKKCKEELVNENGTSSKVVSLKRLHQENCDENDFENLITENQIYGNKIVVKEKSQGTSQEQGLKTKNKTDKTNQVEPKNVVLQPNFLYLSNVQFPANLMMIKNNKMGSDNNKNRTIVNDKANDTICNNSNDSITINTISQSITQNKEIHVLKTNNNILQSFPSKNTKQDIVFQTTNQKVIMNPQIVYQVPMIVDAESKINPPFVNKDFPKIVPPCKKEFQKPFEQSKNEKLFIACPYQMDSKLQPKIVITNLRPKIAKIEEISSLDIYEKRKRLRRLKYLTNRENKTTELPKAEVKKVQDSGRNIITPDKMKTEIYKELTRIKVKIDDESSGTDSEYAEDEMEEYKSIITQYGKSTKNLETQDNSNKAEFLAIFKLATQAQYKEKMLDRQERIIRKDAVVSAYIAAGRLDCISIEEPSKDNKENKENHDFSYKKRKVILEENISNQKSKQSFLTNLHLTRVTEKSKADYEAIWEEIVKERKRRGQPIKTNASLKLPKLEKSLSEIDTNDQLQILTEIKQHVTDNNNLIKQRMDSFCCNGDSIKILAEKNISELSRLSKMADRSVKLFSGQDTKKRDLNPGFDSENIQGGCKFYPEINIPNVSKIISLKSEQTTCTILSAPATSMDEPSNCAAGVDDVQPHVDLQRIQDFACQVDEPTSWPGVEALVRMYKEHDIARKKEMAELHRRNTQLRVESAHITRAASRDSDRARHLLAERRNLASEEHTVRTSLQWLYSIVDLVRNYDEKKC